MPQHLDGVNIVITGDASQASGEINKLSDALGGLQDSSVIITADTSQAVSETQKLSDTVDTVDGAHVDITADSSQAQDEAGKASDALANVEDAHAEITADGSQAVDEAGRAQDAIDDVQGTEVDIKARFSEQWMNDLDKAMRGTADKISKHFEHAAEQSAQSFKERFREIAKAADNVSEHFESGFGAVLLGLGAKLGAVVSSMSGVITSALAIGGGFEAQMTSVQVISGATAEELEQLTAKAREMGASLPISAKDAATAMTVLAQRGTSAKDILTSVEDVANLVISQGVDMGTAADMLGSTLTNFSMSIEDAAKVTAIFNNASNQSAMNISKMVEALKYVGPTAGSVGMELTEAMSGMEALANSGLTGEMIGTGLAAVLTKLASKTRILGVETKDAQGKLRPIADIFTELQAKGFSLSEATAEFGARGTLAALNLAKQSASLKENEERLKSWGSTQAAVDAKAKTFPNTMAALTSALEELHISIFDQIKDKAKDAVSDVTALVRAFSEWISKTQLAQKVLQGFFDGLGFKIPTGIDFKHLLDRLDVDMIVDKFRNFGSALKDLGAAIMRVKDVIEAPLEFLIEYMETFAGITFWDWIIDKGLAVPAALLRLGDSFISFGKSLKVILGLNLTSISAFFSSLVATLSSPVLWGALGLAALGTVVAVRVSEYRDAQAALEDSIEREKALLAQQEKADDSIGNDIQLNMKTGFEKLPASWAQASDELREKANDTVKNLRALFSEQVGTAIDAVARKFPDMAEALNETAGNLDFSAFSQITKALQGNQGVFDAMPEHMKKVVEQLYYMDVRAGQATGSIGQLIAAWKELQERTDNFGVAKSDIENFADEINTSINAVLDDLPGSIERLKKFAGGENLQLAVSVSLEQANSQIQELSKSLGEKFKLPANIVDAAIFSKLEALAGKGNTTAQALRNGWQGSGASLEAFLASAQEAISYLGASPEKFTPALNSLSRSIQKIDPLTGQVTEQFKKAHDALKQWSNVTFDQLAQRIQRLRKAVEAGFIDQSALEAEFKRASEQVKLKIAAELEPSRGQFSSREAFNSVVASEYVARMGELGGEAFVELVQREFDSLYDKSGSAIGAAIMRQVSKGTSAGSLSMKINGVEIAAPNVQPQSAFDMSGMMRAFGENAAAMARSIQQNVNPAPVYAEKDYSAALGNIVSAVQGVTDAVGAVEAAVKSGQSAPENAPVLDSLQSISDAVGAIRTLQQQNGTSLAGIIEAVYTIRDNVKEAKTGGNYNIEIHQQGFNVANKSDADYIARSAVQALRSGFGNGGV